MAMSAADRQRAYRARKAAVPGSEVTAAEVAVNCAREDIAAARQRLRSEQAGEARRLEAIRALAERMWRRIDQGHTNRGVSSSVRRECFEDMQELRALLGEVG